MRHRREKFYEAADFEGGLVAISGAVAAEV